MPYKYLEDVAIADAAFEAWGDTIEEVFVAASNATLNIMVGDLTAIMPVEIRHFHVEDSQLDMVLFQVLQELIYYKDAEQVLLLVKSIRFEYGTGHQVAAYIEAAGEKIDPLRHDLIVDVKAITLHRFCVEPTLHGWRASVTVDV
jgi:SHS2 domain-containing protein